MATPPPPREPAARPAEAAPRERRRGPQRPILGGRRITDLATHPDHFIPVSRIAEYYGVSVRTVRDWIAENLLPAFDFAKHRRKGKRKRLIRVRKRDLLAFEAHHEMHPARRSVPVSGENGRQRRQRP